MPWDWVGSRMCSKSNEGRRALLWPQHVLFLPPSQPIYKAFFFFVAKPHPSMLMVLLASSERNQCGKGRRPRLPITQTRAMPNLPTYLGLLT